MKIIKLAYAKFKAQNNEVVSDGVVDLLTLVNNKLLGRSHDSFISFLKQRLKDIVADVRISDAKHLKISKMLLVDGDSAGLVKQLLEQSQAEIVDFSNIRYSHEDHSLKLSDFKIMLSAISENCIDLRIRGIEEPELGITLIEVMNCLNGKKLICLIII